MVGAVEWSNLTVAGAFIAGAILGSFATVRLARYVLEYLRRERDT